MLIIIETGEPWSPSELISEIRYPLNIETFWTDDELAAIGLARLSPHASPVTLDVEITGSGVGGSGGGSGQATEPASPQPPPPPESE